MYFITVEAQSNTFEPEIRNDFVILDDLTILNNLDNLAMLT